MRAFAACALFALVPIAAAAQTAADATQPPTSQGPMIVERVQNGFMLAPDVKATEFDKRVSALIGGSAGWVAQETFFIGGGGYWMPSKRSNDRRLAYGGVVMQWFVLNGDRVGLSAKALVGGGEATLPDTVTQVIGLPDPRELARLTPAQLNDLIRSHTIITTVRSRQDFVVAEPEVNARIGLAKHVRLTLGAGYRFTGSARRGDVFERDGFGRGRRLDGATGTIGIQIGGGSESSLRP